MKRSTTLYGVLAAALTALLGAPASPLAATEVKTFQVQSQKAFLAGTLDGVSIDPTGRLQLADHAERVTAVDEPFLLSAAEHPDGWVVGTGNDGKVLLVTPAGETRELFAAGEGQVFAVHADPDGTVWAGLSPGGAIYRIDPDAGPDAGDGEGTEPGNDDKAIPEPWFETGETYVWDLARSADGALLAATGTSGKLFRLTGDDAESVEGRVLYDSNDTHVRALLARADGSVVLGTAGEGLILRLAADGSVRTLHDAAQPEVVAFAERPDGALYAAVIASEASQVDLSAAAAAAQKGKSGGAGDSGDGAGPGSGPHGGGGTGDPTEGGVQVQVSAGAVSAGSRPAGFSGKRAQILTISPAGVVETAWGFDDETVFDLLWARERLWVATGLEGELYSFDGEHMVLEQDLDERQVVSLLPDVPGPAFATTNAPGLYRLSGTRERAGTYTSAALDAGNVARFGTLRWWGDTPTGSSLEFSLRSGVSSEPDATWSEWTAPGAPSPDGELTVEGLPRGRYVQWRVALEAGDGGTAGPKIDGVELAYRQSNLRPEISAFEILDPGQIIVPAGFNPTLQVFEPVHPNREGIFTTLEQAAASGNGRTKTLWKKGYRSFRWKVADPNGDSLTYALEFRPLYPEDGDRSKDRDAADVWMPVAEDLADDHYSFDATVLPDGVYRFRLLASDVEENAPDEGQVSDQISEPVVIDHSPPRLVEAARDGDVVRAVIEDSHNPLRSAEVSLDAGEWSPAPAADGLLDARRERLEIEIPADARLLLVRVVDAAYNVVTLDLTDRL